MIRLNRAAIGHFYLAPEPVADQAQVHAHITSPEYREQGLVLAVGFQALQYFVEKFGVKKFVFETNLDNEEVNRMLAKTGLPVLATFQRPAEGILQARTVARRELTALDLQQFLASGRNSSQAE